MRRITRGYQHNKNMEYRMENGLQCREMPCSQIRRKQKRPIWQYKLGDEEIHSADKEKDLGVTITKKFDPEDHINQITSKMYYLLANMKTAFTYVMLMLIWSGKSSALI